jgi:hypothetical protein
MHVFDITRCAGDAAPELRMALIAVSFRDVRLFFDVLPQMLAVDGTVRPVRRGKGSGDVDRRGCRRSRPLPALARSACLTVMTANDQCGNQTHGNRQQGTSTLYSALVQQHACRPRRLGQQHAPFDEHAGTYRLVATGSSGRWRVLSGSLFTSSTIFAYARVVACRPVHGTVSGVSRSLWK